jgi:hypothetical protein
MRKDRGKKGSEYMAERMRRRQERKDNPDKYGRARRKAKRMEKKGHTTEDKDSRVSEKSGY